MNKVILMMCALAVSAGVTDAASYSLSLKDAIRMSTDKNSSVRAAGFTAEAARQGVGIAGSRYFPVISFEEAFTASNAPTQTFMMKLDQGRFTQDDFLINNLNHPRTQHDFRTAITLQQPLFNPATAPAREMAVKEAESQGLGYETSKEQTAFQVFRIYLEVQKADAQLRATDKAVADAREHMRLAVVRNAAGVGLKSDELRARTHLASIEQQQISARNNLALAKLQLANVIGLADGDTVEIADTTSTAVPPLPPEDLVTVALESRSDLKQSRAELEKSEAGVSLARSGYLPSLDSFASYQLNAKNTPFGSDNDAWAAGISLKWQLFDGFKRYREKDRAVATRSAAAEQYESRQREIRYRVRESGLRKDEMSKRLEVARHSLVDAEETVRLLTKRFENSLATMVEVLDAQSALNQVRAGLVESEANYALASGMVFHTAGIFMKEMLK